MHAQVPLQYVGSINNMPLLLLGLRRHIRHRAIASLYAVPTYSGSMNAPSLLLLLLLPHSGQLLLLSVVCHRSEVYLRPLPNMDSVNALPVEAGVDTQLHSCSSSSSSSRRSEH
jgi:hypothetical protein